MTVTIWWPFNFYPSSQGTAAVGSDINSPVPVTLHHYANPEVSPPSARIDRNHKVRAGSPLRLWHVWKYAVFAATKGVELSTAVLSHHLLGPRKKSWGIEMTIVTAFMRGAGKNSPLITIPTIRTLMSLGGLAPLPSDALVTPVTFRVKRRGLNGILAESDSQETGARELSGEWVVGKRTWMRLQADWKKGSKGTASPSGEALRTSRQRVVLYVHGGAYYTSSAAAQRLISIPLAKHTDARVFAIDYRLAPETQFPGPLHDIVSTYFRLIDDLHIPAENILLTGDSAGGGLCLALLMYLRDNSYPLPSGAILMSPWVDLTMSCESWDSNAPYDVLPIPSALPDDQLNPISLYLGTNMEKYLTHPYASPLFGDFNGLPPLLIQAGDAEVLRDEITLLAHKATASGVKVRHEIYEDGIHIFQAYPFFQATSQAFVSCRDFVRNFLPPLEHGAPGSLGAAAEAELEHEIGNEKATVVRGDGVETGTGIEQVNEDFDEADGPTETDSSEEDAATSRRYQSWGRQSKWILSDDDSSEDEEKAAGSSSRPPREKKVGRRRSETLPSNAQSPLERLTSAMTLMTPDPPSRPKSSAADRDRPRQHRRTSSHQPQLSDKFSRLSSFTSRTPSFASCTPTSSGLPSPSLRRSNVSHPDITTLVQQWTKGPANQTYMYKPRSNY